MNKSISYVYFHGGPGLNSTAEKAILEPIFLAKKKQIFFWNEPSKLRPEGDVFDPEKAFSNMIKSAQSFLTQIKGSTGNSVHAICHSFSVNQICHVILEQPDLIDSLTILAPAFNYGEVLKNILKFAISDFTSSQPEKAEQIKDLVSKSTKTFDEPMQQAFALAATDEKLFTHYWKNTDAMESYFSTWAQAGAQLDVESFFQASKEFVNFPSVSSSIKKIKVPTTAFFGDYDRVIVDLKEALSCFRLFEDFNFKIYYNSGHFPHLEELDRFVTDITSS